MAKRNSSSRRWLDRHFNDEYVKRAQRDGFRSRAIYKLMEIQQRDRLFKPGMRVVDLGAAPGSWSEYAAQQVGDKGCVVALDILPMDSLADVTFIQEDFTQQAALEKLEHALQGQALDLVISDIAPNVTGQKAVDQPRSMYLVELALDFAAQTLKPNGAFVSKVFQGEGFDDFVRDLKSRFSRVVTRKPDASRAASREVYLVATGFRVTR
ncbi:MAG: 23S rRNA (uridine(2552)-2'-O)-methyltransferase RlmE [gamma proteobacterium symbiont of Bathyaustriella thionipta]|nr:23S rRNA (uridine(2552)-2'-O)-methyltransferase RlmE [gamma proteobacterium symbiont of Bathyaustriella thionipta]